MFAEVQISQSFWMNVEDQNMSKLTCVTEDQKCLRIKRAATP